MLLLLPMVLLGKAAYLGGGLAGPQRSLTDFDAFYVAGQMARRGDINGAYHFATMADAEVLFAGKASFMPWTYPPPFDLLVAGLAALPEVAAYLLFTGTTLALFLTVLRAIAVRDFPFVFLAFYPAILLNIASGQNGFLTGSLIGLACLALRRNRPIAGVPLGLMVIKPHLAVAFAVNALLERRWFISATAAATAALLSVIATVAFGVTVWSAFARGVSEAGAFLAAGAYPLFRMVSVYAGLRSLQCPAPFAGLAQGVVACAALGVVAAETHFRRPWARVLGLTALVSPMISPYAYDYDLTIAAVGLALLMPTILRLSSASEQLALLILAVVASGFGLVMSLAKEAIEQTGSSWSAGTAFGGEAGLPSLAGFMFLALGLLTLRIVRRDPAGSSYRNAPAQQRSSGLAAAHLTPVVRMGWARWRGGDPR